MKTIKKINESYIGETPIATTIDSSSTNSEVASAKAVYDLHQEMTPIIMANDYWNANDLTLSSTNVYTTIPLASRNQVGNAFSVNNSGEIVCNVNIDLLFLSAKCSVDPTSSARNRFVQIQKNGNYYTVNYQYLNASQSASIVLPNVLFTSLVAGDRISVNLYGQSGDKASQHNTNVTILAYNNINSTNIANNTRLMTTGSLAKLGNKEEVSGETLEKTKLDEVTDKDVGEQITEVKEVEPTKEIEESGDKGE